MNGGVDMLPKLIVIAGTNASGKSGLGVELALRYGGEIVSADSRQGFRGLDLGEFPGLALGGPGRYCGAGKAAFFGGRHGPVRGFGGGRL